MSWTAPYTLNNVPITGYSIDDNSGRILNITDLSYILSPVCDMANVTVTVSAVNRAGVGQPADTSFYYKRGIKLLLTKFRLCCRCFHCFVNAERCFNQHLQSNLQHKGICKRE